MQRPAVTIVVVPRDHFSDARDSLESIYANAALELVYVDGESPPAVARYLREQSSARGFRRIAPKSHRASERVPQRFGEENVAN
jgi:hypothetical protein